MENRTVDRKIRLEQRNDRYEVWSIGKFTSMVSLKLVSLGDGPKLERIGLQEQKIPTLSEKVLDGASRINMFLNSGAAEKGIDPKQAVNIFWFGMDGVAYDNVFLRIPLHTEEQILSAFVMLCATKGSGREFVRALQGDSIDKRQVQNLLREILTVKSGQNIDPSQIIANHLVMFPGSTLQLASEAIDPRARLPLLFEKHKGEIVIRDIPDSVSLQTEEGGQEVPLDEFVKKSVFFREESSSDVPGDNKNESDIFVDKKAFQADFCPHPRDIDIKGKSINLQGLGVHAKGITEPKRKMLGIEKQTNETDYSYCSVFDGENTKDLIEMCTVLAHGINDLKAHNPFENWVDKKLFIVKARDHGKAYLMIRVPDRGSRVMDGDSDWRPYQYFSLVLKADEPDLNFVAESILEASSPEDVKLILDAITHTDINKAFGIPHNLDDRVAMLKGVDEIFEIGRKKGGDYYNPRYSADRDAIRSIIKSSLIENSSKKQPK